MDELERRLANASGRAELARVVEERLRAVVASGDPAAVAAEVGRLAERLAERMDAERRAECEIAIARDVQRRLFPQQTPELPHVELAARCVQARSAATVAGPRRLLDLLPS